MGVGEEEEEDQVQVVAYGTEEAHEDSVSSSQRDALVCVSVDFESNLLVPAPMMFATCPFHGLGRQIWIDLSVSSPFITQ